MREGVVEIASRKGRGGVGVSAWAKDQGHGFPPHIHYSFLAARVHRASVVVLGQ